MFRPNSTAHGDSPGAAELRAAVADTRAHLQAVTRHARRVERQLDAGKTPGQDGWALRDAAEALTTALTRTMVLLETGEWPDSRPLRDLLSTAGLDDPVE